MNLEKFVKLTHHEHGEPVLLRLDSIERFSYYSKKDVTLIKFKGGTGMYVKEKVEDIQNLLLDADVNVFELKEEANNENETVSNHEK